MSKEIIKPWTKTEFAYEAMDSDGNWIGVDSYAHAVEKLGRKPVKGEYRPCQPDTIIKYSSDGCDVMAHWSNGSVTIWGSETSSDRAVEVATIRNTFIAE